MTSPHAQTANTATPFPCPLPFPTHACRAHYPVTLVRMAGHQRPRRVETPLRLAEAVRLPGIARLRVETRGIDQRFGTAFSLDEARQFLWQCQVLPTHVRDSRGAPCRVNWFLPALTPQANDDDNPGIGTDHENKNHTPEPDLQHLGESGWFARQSLVVDRAGRRVILPAAGATPMTPVEILEYEQREHITAAWIHHTLYAPHHYTGD